MEDKLRILLGNVNQIIVDLVRDDIREIDIEIETYDLKKGINKTVITKELKKRYDKLMKMTVNILAEVQVKNYNKIVELVKALYLFINDNYFVSTQGTFKNFENYKKINNSIIKKLKHILFNLRNFKDNKDIDNVYSPFPANFLYDFFKVDDEVLTIESNELGDFKTNDEKFNELYMNFKQLNKYITTISSLLSDVKTKQLLVEFLATNPLKKKFPIILEKIVKLLKDSKKPKIKEIIARIVAINIMKKIKEFFIYIEKRKMQFLSMYENDILNKFYYISLKKKEI